VSGLDREGLLDHVGVQGGVTGVDEDRPQMTADGLCDTERPFSAGPAAQLVEGGDHGRVAQEAPEHEVGELAAVPVRGHVATDLG
jgi:hypothetical protein